jgi:hypothetical protein
MRFDELVVEMDSELLQSFVRTRMSDDADQEPRSVYASTRTGQDQNPARRMQSQEVTGELPKVNYVSRRSKNNVVIEQRKPRKIKESYDVCYTDKDRAAAVTFGEYSRFEIFGYKKLILRLLIMQSLFQ